MNKRLIGLSIVVLSGCCGKAIVTNPHAPLSIPEICVFDKFTEEEINYLKQQPTQSIGKKIYLNQTRCKFKEHTANELVKKHNELHEIKE